MRMRTASIVTSLALTLVLAGASTAAADELATGADAWPTADIDRPLSLTRHLLQIGATVELNLSKDLVGKPVTIAPSAFFGITDKVTIGITHTGVLGAGSLCVSGKSNGCPRVYHNLNLEAFHSLLRGGRFELASHPALMVPAFSPRMLIGFRIAATARYTVVPEAIAIISDPGMLIGLNRRTKGNVTELLSIPIELQFQASPGIELHVTSGIAGSLSKPSFGDSYTVPLGFGLTYVYSHALDIGADFVFPNLGGKQAPDTKRTDDREVSVRVVWRH